MARSKTGGRGARSGAKGPAAPEAAREARAGRRGELRTALAFGALAAVVRLLFLASGDDRAFPYTAFYEGDAEVYFRMARSFLEGTLYDFGLPMHPPGFAFGLAALHALLGAGAVGAQVPHLVVKAVLGVVVGGGTVALVHLLAARLFGAVAAAFAALVVTFHFGAIVLSLAPVGDGLYGLLLLAALALFVRRLDGGERTDRRAELLLGLLLGALALTRAEGIAAGAILVGAGLVAALRSATLSDSKANAVRGRIARRWLVVVAVAAAVVAPWTIRNAVRLGELETRMGIRLPEPFPRFVPVTLYGPLNLALANFDGADGTFSRAALDAGARSGKLSLEDPETLRFFLHGDRLAFDWIRTHPGAFVRLAGRKLALAGDGLRLGIGQYDLPGGLAGVRRPVDIFVPEPSAGTTILVVLALALPLAGGLLAFRRGGLARRFTIVAGLLALLSAALVALFFGYARFAVMLVPLGAIFAGVAFAALVAKIPAPRRRAARFAAIGVVAALLAVEAYGTFAGHRLEASGSTLPGSSKLDRDQPIRLRPLPQR